jgi:hypothetical protein
MKWASWINVVFGLWLSISPWVFLYRLDAARVNDFFVGIGIAVAGLWSVSVPSAQTTPAWLNVLLGAWLVSAPWVLGYVGRGAYTAMNNDVSIGLLTVAFAAIRLTTRRPVGEI